MHESHRVDHEVAINAGEESAISLAKQLINSFRLTDLQPLLKAVESQAKNQFLNVVVFGRFKAGKSSFLNHLLGKPILPVGVIPVTSVVTEICHGPRESVQVIYQRGRKTEEVSIDEIGTYISEGRNPENRLGVELVRVFVPEMAPYQRLRLIDTPGLESNLAHNTEASLAWSPQTDLALVAVGVDPPLTQQDVSLIERLHRFTPSVSVLLTKVDILSSAEQQEVLEFVRTQLNAKFSGGVRVYPFSIKAGHEELREHFLKEYLLKSLNSFQEAHSEALERKLYTLLSSAADYLQLALRSAQAKETDREVLRAKVLGSGQSHADLRLQFQLIADRAAATTRTTIERRLRERVRSRLQKTLEDRLTAELPHWRGSFAKTLRQFEQWLASQMKEELTTVSLEEGPAFLETLQGAQRQCRGLLQTFRDQLSEEVQRVFGTALRTAETEIEVCPPRAPDVSINRIFDHEWEALSIFIPNSLVRVLVTTRFIDKVESEVFKNLSRLTSQWEEAICGAIRASEKEAHRRLEELTLTVQRLLSSEDAMRTDAIRDHLQQLQIEIARLRIPRSEPV